MSKGRRTGGSIIVVLGDQLDHDSPALCDADPTRDVVVMMEVREESTHVPSHAARTTLFLSAMRHFASELRGRGYRVVYSTIIDPDNTQSFATELPRLAKQSPCSGCERIVTVEAGEHRVREIVASWEHATGLPVETRADTHFLASREQFASWVKGRKQLTMEYFYRWQRQRLNVLMELDGTTPVGGQWNFDHDNRESFGARGPSPRPRPPLRHEPDDITLSVIRDARSMLPDAPGSSDDFAWPVTRDQALASLDDFIAHRLPLFGKFEDAMWTSEPVLYHSTLSPALNLKLLRPLECVEAAVHAYETGHAPIESVEAFIRQIIGWREFIRGVYDREGPTYASRNWLDEHGTLPACYWTGTTELACVRECAGQVLRSGYGHHIQRLMVLGNLALIAGVHPREISDWFLAMYVDAVDWVTLPNTLGMVMHADGTDSSGPVVGTKPYCASGQYIKRMSNYCKKCRYDPTNRGDDPTTRERACPFTLFYWDFLARHRARFERNPRMATIIKNLDRFGEQRDAEIRISAACARRTLGIQQRTQP